MFSFSIIAYELITGETPYKKITNPFILMNKVMNGKRPDLSIIKNEEIKTYLSKWWNDDPNERPNFDQIVNQIKQEAFKKAMGANESDVNNYLHFLYGKLPPLNNNSNLINQKNRAGLIKHKQLGSLKSPKISPKLINLHQSKRNHNNESLIERPKMPESDSNENQDMHQRK